MKTIIVDNLHYTYPNGHKALDGLSFSVSAGACSALVGPNGAGKSTVLLHLNGILRGNSGIIQVSGVDPNKDPKQSRIKVGVVFQNPDDQFIMPTVLEDVAFSPLNLGKDKKQALEIAEKCLSMVGMQHQANREPHQLSQGEKKRVQIAGVIAAQPDILALDEPTANLDPRWRREIISLISNLESTRIIATHDLEMVKEICSEATLIYNGQAVYSGEALGLLKDAKLLESCGLEMPISLKLDSISIQ